MDIETTGNERYLLFQHAVQCFEKCQETRDNIYSQPDDILKHQIDCLNIINEITIQFEIPEPYFIALCSIQQDLIRLIEKTKSHKDQITINDLTITRTSNSNLEPFGTTLAQIFSTAQSTFEPEVKKPKINNEDKHGQKLRNTIENTLVVPQSTGLVEIAGMEDTKNLLQEAIMFPIQYPQLFTGERKKWNKALLYGPPGTGKTKLVHCLAAEIKTRLYCVSSSDLCSSYVGESEKLVKMLFQYCQETDEQCLIFIDEIDSICRVRGQSEAEYERRFKNQLLTQLSEMDRNPNNKIFFLACTNLPWELDPAFIRRFQRRIYIPLPDRATRLQIFKIQCKSADLFDSEQWNRILDQTEGWSGSDITDLINFAMYQPIKELRTADEWLLTEDKKYMPVKNSKHSTLKLKIHDIPAHEITVRSIELKDFFVALKNVSKTISEDTLRQFKNFNKNQFGNRRMVNKELVC